MDFTADEAKRNGGLEEFTNDEAEVGRAGRLASPMRACS